MDREQDRRERAYKIWEDEGRPEGHHEDHWQRAEDQHEATEQEAANVAEANEHASGEFNNGKKKRSAVVDSRPPSIVAPD
ncbi:DUF2934 domain-containing protein [Rhizobium sp. Root1220]|uniref:DUF2934 domain-containing protein n=1 Tax=Rhizobium sp. Root1220 TaxID=1736432 RepID=UPI0006F7D71E|nr:DUF2934 domain-containing protein [Rhizobium sp. Root1220]KQV82151.1 hypothetical protein ASC90_23880 [Rhizobium sp. Root1220]